MNLTARSDLTMAIMTSGNGCLGKGRNAKQRFVVTSQECEQNLKHCCAEKDGGD